MCLIVDANLAAQVFGKPPHSDFKPIIEWLTSDKKDGKLVIGGHLSIELNKVGEASRFVKALLQSGRARLIPDHVIEDETDRMRTMCVSNDPHVIALARVSGARVLCSNDVALHRDFTNQELVADPRGHVYQTTEHEHLLRLYGHTPACKRNLA
jgi:hypothetical protein